MKDTSAPTSVMWTPCPEEQIWGQHVTQSFLPLPLPTPPALGLPCLKGLGGPLSAGPQHPCALVTRSPKLFLLQTHFLTSFRTCPCVAALGNPKAQTFEAQTPCTSAADVCTRQPHVNQ